MMSLLQSSFLLALCLSAAAKVLNYIPQSFFFDWNVASQPFPVPVTAQCEMIHIQWTRTSVATGPDPVAPYYLQVYTSNFVFPFIIPAGDGPSFDWEVPFAPGTLYQICMVDREGHSGGCQDIYTVTAPAGTASCSNVTFPLAPLDVSAVQSSGTLSQYGWIDQCTDIGITPRNGTAPYTITIAPTLHPPYNVTIDDMSRFNWTVSLTWASSFFIGVSDSAGNAWANGPLHSGGGASASSSCLTKEKEEKEGVSAAVPVGAGVGGLAIGIIAGIASAAFFYRRKEAKRRKFNYNPDHHIDETYVTPYDQLSPTSAHQPQRSTSNSTRPLLNPGSPPEGHTSIGSDYYVEPFSMPGEHGQLTSPMSPHAGPTPSGSQTSTSGGGRTGGRIYVVHHDAVRPPVTVYHEDGTEVVELPPQYDREQLEGARSDSATRVGSPSSSTDRRAATDTDLPGFLQQQRHPDITHKRPPTSPVRLDPPGPH